MQHREGRLRVTREGLWSTCGSSRSFNSTSKTLVVLLVCLSPFHLSQEPGSLGGVRGLAWAGLTEFCELQVTRVELRRTVTEEGPERRALVCRGNATLTSCEGQCESTVIPSVVSNVGFLKKCTCCMETSMQLAKIQLPYCVSDDGTFVSQAVHETMIQVPSACACQTCDP